MRSRSLHQTIDWHKFLGIGHVRLPNGLIQASADGTRAAAGLSTRHHPGGRSSGEQAAEVLMETRRFRHLGWWDRVKEALQNLASMAGEIARLIDAIRSIIH
jgi:hypothetical protein